MIKLLLPVLVAAVAGYILFKTSAWRTGRMLDSRSRPLNEAGILRYAGMMARELNLDRLDVHVFDDPGLNGLAAPDGRIFITRGFIEAHRAGQVTTEEIASVIAHELGHVGLGHSRRRMVDFSGQNAFRVGLMILFARFVPVIGPYIGAMLAGLASSVIGAKLSRGDELEADAFAATLLTRIGVGAGPQVSLLRKLERKNPGATQPTWLLSHPRPADRIAAIEALAAQLR